MDDDKVTMITESGEPKEYGQAYWKEEISTAEKRLKNYYKTGDKVIERYLDYRGEGDPQAGGTFRLNLFNTHVSTLLAMLYGRVPNTDVSRRHADAKDDVGRVAAEIFNRLLNTTVEEPGSDFSDTLRACLQDRLLPGHGIARVRYAFESEMVDDPLYEAQEDDEEDAGKLEDIIDEEAPVDYVHWRDFLWGFGRMWKDVPWIAFRVPMDEPKFIERFGEEKAEFVQFVEQKVSSNESSAMMSEITRGPTKQAEVLEIWCRETKKVYFYHDSSQEILEEKEDPLGLRGFFPAPEPMIANPTTTIYRPTSDFMLAQDLYNEIDTLQTRIGIITKAVRVIGVYDQAQPKLQNMFNQGQDNTLIPVDNWAAFAEKGGIRGVVEWFPVQDIVAALTQLEALRDNSIELLYQVTGLSDILRGASGPDRESAASATSRTKFASIRVQHLQEEFGRFASDLMTLRAQVVAKHWDIETILVKSNAAFLHDDEELVMQSLELIKQPDSIWPWRVEIKPESIAMIDYAQIQQDRTLFLQGMGQFLQSSQGIIEGAPEAAPMVLEMVRWALAGYKGAQQIEGVVDKTIDMALKKLEQQKNNPDNNGEQAKAQAKMQEIQAKNQAKLQEQAQKHQQEMQKLLAEAEITMQELDGETNAAIIREKFQAHYNIMEKRVAEQIQQRAKAEAAREKASNAKT